MIQVKIKGPNYFLSWNKYNILNFAKVQYTYHLKRCVSSSSTSDVLKLRESIHDLHFMTPLLQNGKGLLKNNKNNCDNHKFVTILLNNTLDEYSYPILLNSDFLICADGGANRLYDWCKQENKIELKYKQNRIKEKSSACDDSLFIKKELLLPDIICGDLDSIRKEVWLYYEKHSVEIEKIEDQNTTDLDKCLQRVQKQPCSNVVTFILGATGGRFDHTCANISTVYKNKHLSNIYLISEYNFIFLLKEGYNKILIDRNIFEKNCGIIPIGSRSIIKTEGLRYNLHNQSISFDSLISSSNEIITEDVSVCSNSAVLWCMQLKPLSHIYHNYP